MCKINNFLRKKQLSSEENHGVMLVVSLNLHRMTKGNHENPQESQCPGQDSSQTPETHVKKWLLQQAS